MQARIIRRITAVLLLLASLVLLLWGLWPGIERTKQQIISRSEMEVPSPIEQPGAQSPAVLEERLLTLEWPATLRQDDANRFIKLTLAVAENGIITTTVTSDRDEISGEPVLIPNIYDNHNVTAEARLEAAGLEFNPRDLFSQSLLPGQTVTFTWSVRAEKAGNYRGTVWLFLRFFPLDGGADSQVALSAQAIEIQAVNLFGFGGTAARLSGMVGAAASGLLGANDIVKGVGRLFQRLHLRK